MVTVLAKIIIQEGTWCRCVLSSWWCRCWWRHMGCYYFRIRFWFRVLFWSRKKCRQKFVVNLSFIENWRLLFCRQNSFFFKFKVVKNRVDIFGFRRSILVVGIRSQGTETGTGNDISDDCDLQNPTAQKLYSSEYWLKWYKSRFFGTRALNEWMNEMFIVFSKDTIINDNATWMVTFL